MFRGEEEEEPDDDSHHNEETGLGEYVVQLGSHVETWNISNIQFIS